MGSQGLLIINDAYNASPASMKASVSTFLSIFPNRKKIVVLGDMFELGEQTEIYHREVGEDLQEMQGDFQLVTIGSIARNIAEGYGKNAHHFSSKEEATPFLAQFKAKEYAMILKASRGMKLETLLDGLVPSKENS